MELVRADILTGMVVGAGSRLKFEAARNRAQVNAQVRKWTVGAIKDGLQL